MARENPAGDIRESVMPSISRPVGDADTYGVGMGIESCTDVQAGLGSRVADELDDGLMIDQGSCAPVLVMEFGET
jgi:hypothetical protein